jgi:hypothetical protein
MYGPRNLFFLALGAASLLVMANMTLRAARKPPSAQPTDQRFDVTRQSRSGATGSPGETPWHGLGEHRFRAGYRASEKNSSFPGSAFCV